MTRVGPSRAPVAGLNIQRLALVLALTGLVAVVAVVLGNTLAYLSLRDRYERAEIERIGQRAAQSLDEQLTADKNLVKEYAYWQSTYQLLGPEGMPGAQEFWESDFARWLPPHYGSTLVALFDRGGATRYAWRDSLRAPRPEMVARSGLLSLLDRSRLRTGIIAFPEGLFQVAAGVVLPDDSAHVGLPHRGYFVLAQPLADSLVRRVSLDLQMSARLEPLPGGAHTDRPTSRVVAGGDSLETRIALHDLFGRPVALMRIATSRAFIVQLERRLVSLTLLSGLLALAFLALVYLVARWALVKPVSAIGGRLDEMQQSGELRPIDLPAPTREWSLLIGAFNQAIAMRSESQGRLESLLGSMTDVVWSITPDGRRMLFVNDAIGALTGHPPDYFYAEAARWDALIHPEDAPRVAQSFRELGRQPPNEIVFRVVRTDGGIRWVQSRAWPFRDAAGSLLRVDGITRDITEARAMEAERARLEEHARQAQRLEALGTLAGGIAHDFNNILSAIVGNVEIAGTRLPADHPAQANLEETLRASQRAADLVRQILTFSRRREQERSVLRLNPVVEEALRLVRVGLPPGVELVSRIDPATPAVLADAGQIHQVVVNLCRNAWQALEPQGGRLTVTLEPLAADAPDRGLLPGLTGAWAHLRVADTGPGMEEAVREKVFEPFFTTKPAGQGTGLGLAVVHGIVRAHGAQVRVDSAPGRGATFHVYFPATLETSTGAAAAPVPLLPRRGGRLLFVDDEAPLRQLVEAVLPGQGVEVTVCADGAEALRRLDAAGPFDLIVTDLAMPGLDGLALLRRLEARRPRVPVLISTGFRGDLDEAELRRHGVVGILEKPYALAELGAAVARVLAAAEAAAPDGGRLG